MSSNMIPAGKFKTHCLQIMENVCKTGKAIVIIKRNVPVAQIVPIETQKKTGVWNAEGDDRDCGRYYSAY